MDTVLTEDALTILWDGHERSGILAYEYWPGPASVGAPRVAAWPSGTETKAFVLRDIEHDPPGWTVIEWTILVCQWPPVGAWFSLIESILVGLCEGGASVAWCGLEGHFADPPSLFLPCEMSGGVWASYHPRIGFACSAMLGDPFAGLHDSHLERLRALLPPDIDSD
jgi:hypothetical protein